MFVKLEVRAGKRVGTKKGGGRDFGLYGAGGGLLAVVRFGIIWNGLGGVAIGFGGKMTQR